MSSSDPIPRFARRYRVGIALSFAFFVAYFDRTNVAVLIADHDFVRDLGIDGNRFDQGLLITAFLFPYGLSNLVTGPIGDRLRGRPALLAAVTSWTVIMIASGFAHSFATMIGCRILLGFFESIMTPACSLIVAQWFPDRERARANAAWLAGLFLAPAFSFPVLAFVIAYSGWRASFMTLAAVGFVIGVPIIWFWTKNNPEEDTRITAAELTLIRSGQSAALKERTRAAWPEYRRVFANPRYWFGVVGYCGWTVGFWGINTFVPSYLRQVRHLSFQNSSISAILPWVSATLLVIGGAALGDRLIHRRAVIWSAGYVLAAVLCVLLLQERDTVRAILLLSLAVGVLSGTLGPMWAVVQEMSTSATTGAVTGWFNGITYMVGAAGPAVMGRVVDVTHSYDDGFYLLCAWLVFTALMVVPLWRTPARANP